MKPIIIDTHTLIVISVCYLVVTMAGDFIDGFVKEHFDQRRLAKRKVIEEDLIKLLKSDAPQNIKQSAVINHPEKTIRTSRNHN